MNIINAIIFGIVQGITEFLPISSSGHLVILHNFIELPIKDSIIFDVILHLATLLAVVWFFRKEVLELLSAWIKSFKGKMDSKGRMSWLIILATIPAALAGFLFEDIIEESLHNINVVIFMLVFVGALFIVFEKISRKKDEMEKLNWKNSLLIGIAQAVSLIPGTSRSGITIIAGLGAGLKREAAIKFSFLLSIPIILGANIKKFPDMLGTSFFAEEIMVLSVAFLASFFTGVMAIKYFLQFSKRYSLNYFAYYRFALAIILFIFLVL